MPLARSAWAMAAASTSSAKSMVPRHVAALRRLGHERLGERARLGPAVEQLGGAVAAPDGELEPALVEHPAHAVLEQEQRGERGGVVGLVEAGVLERDRQAERRWYPPVGGTEALDALDGGGGAQREPEPTVAGEALLRREVVHVEVGGLDREPTGAGRGVDQHEAVVAGAAHVGHHAGRRLVVRVGVGVDGGVGDELGMRARLGAQHDRVVEERRGGGDGGELGGELAEHEVLGAVVDQAERGGVPERGAAAVAEQHLVAVGEARRGRRGRRGCCRRRSARRAGGGWCRGSWRRPRRAPGPLSGRTFEGRIRSARRPGCSSAGRVTVVGSTAIGRDYRRPTVNARRVRRAGAPRSR